MHACMWSGVHRPQSPGLPGLVSYLSIEEAVEDRHKETLQRKEGVVSDLPSELLCLPKGWNVGRMAGEHGPRTPEAQG